MKDTNSIKELVRTFHFFASYSGLEPNLSKCEVVGIGSLKGVKVAACGRKTIDLTKETVKILGIHFSYNKVIQMEKKFITTITKIENVLKLRRHRNLTLEGKIIIFKTLAISKIVFLAMILPIPKQITDEVLKIQKNFSWNNSKAKIKHDTLCNSFENGGLKNVDINFKINSLQCSWIKRLLDDRSHDWKVIPLHLIKKSFGKNFRFHSNLDFNSNLLNRFLPFYKNILLFWSKNLSSLSVTPSCILSQFLWFNKYVKISKKPIFFKEFSNKNINYTGQLFNERGTLKNWICLKNEFYLDEKMYFKWIQIINSIPKTWKELINELNNTPINLVLHDHHLSPIVY